MSTLTRDASMAAWRASNDVASEQAIFQALNVAHTYGRMSIPEALLLNRDEARA